MSAHTESHTGSTTDAGDRDPVLLLTIPQAARRLAIGRSTLYTLIGAGELEVVHIRRAVRVPVEAVDDFLARRRASRDYRAGLFPSSPAARWERPVQ